MTETTRPDDEVPNGVLRGKYPKVNYDARKDGFDDGDRVAITYVSTYSGNEKTVVGDARDVSATSITVDTDDGKTWGIFGRSIKTTEGGQKAKNGRPVGIVQELRVYDMSVDRTKEYDEGDFVVFRKNANGTDDYTTVARVDKTPPYTQVIGDDGLRRTDRYKLISNPGNGLPTYQHVHRDRIVGAYPEIKPDVEPPEPVKTEANEPVTDGGEPNHRPKTEPTDEPREYVDEGQDDRHRSGDTPLSLPEPTGETVQIGEDDKVRVEAGDETRTGTLEGVGVYAASGKIGETVKHTVTFREDDGTPFKIVYKEHKEPATDVTPGTRDITLPCLEAPEVDGTPDVDSIEVVDDEGETCAFRDIPGVTCFDAGTFPCLPCRLQGAAYPKGGN